MEEIKEIMFRLMQEVETLKAENQELRERIEDLEQENTDILIHINSMEN